MLRPSQPWLNTAGVPQVELDQEDVAALLSTLDQPRESAPHLSQVREVWIQIPDGYQFPRSVPSTAVLHFVKPMPGNAPPNGEYRDVAQAEPDTTTFKEGKLDKAGASITWTQGALWAPTVKPP